jgi:glycosyltransferase involved in cell wall biosynthesis
MIRSYAVITPARDEADNLPRLAESLGAQTLPPNAWKIVDNGSTDETLEVAEGIAAANEWVDVLEVPGATSANRGAPVVLALQAGIASLEDDPPEVVVNLDADVSFDPTYFERLLAQFDEDETLGIASGSAFEPEGDSWRQRHVTGSTVWGASRAYRWECLQDLLPLEERIAWDGIDEFKANVLGWRTHSFEDLPFRHHRPEGVRDGSAWRARLNQGHAAHYLGYRFWYLVLRALWNARRDPAALAMIAGYASAVARRRPRSLDTRARSYLRSQQSFRRLRLRALEAAGRRHRPV